MHTSWEACLYLRIMNQERYSLSLFNLPTTLQFACAVGDSQVKVYMPFQLYPFHCRIKSSLYIPPPHITIWILQWELVGKGS